MTNILIVEDESIVAWDIKETLEKLGHQVVDLVVSGAEAIRLATTSRPDLVLMDIRLAGAIDGITAGAEIYDRLNIPVVYLTAHADERTLERATQSNPFGYIIKPFRSQTLQSTIKVALQRHHSEASGNLHQVGLTDTLNSIGSGVITTDRQGVVTFINPKAEELTGWHSTEAIGNQIGQVFRLSWDTDSIAIENPSLRAMRLQQSVNSPDRCWLTAKDKTQIPISDTATPVYKPDGQIVGSIVVFQNNTDRLSTEIDLRERNQDLEDFQLNLISQLQSKTAEYQQAIACTQILDLLLNEVNTARNESELLQLALQQLGVALNVDYCWCTLHDAQDTTAKIVCEYIDPQRQILPTSNIGKEIDVLLYPKFYDRLFGNESWIDPAPEIIPAPYFDLLAPAAQMLICPIIAAPPGMEDLAEPLDGWAIGEVGAISTGKPPWTAFQAQLISQIISYAVKIFRQTHHRSPDRKSLAISLKWLDSFKDEFRTAIADVDRAMHISAQILQDQIRSLDLQTQNLSTIEHHRSMHQNLTANLQILQAEWQRQFQLIGTLVNVQTNGTSGQIQSLSDIQFSQWIAKSVKTCSALAQRYRQQFGHTISDILPLKLAYPFTILELIVLELFENACKYTPPDRLIVLEIDVRDNQLQFSVISLGIQLSTRELELMFLPFAHNSQDLASPSGITGVGLALVNKLVPLLGGKIRAISDRNATSLILTLPVA